MSDNLADSLFRALQAASVAARSTAPTPQGFWHTQETAALAL